MDDPPAIAPRLRARRLAGPPRTRTRDSARGAIARGRYDPYMTEFFVKRQRNSASAKREGRGACGADMRLRVTSLSHVPLNGEVTR
jgi:hypothetical protein